MANRTRDTANLVSANNLYVDISTDKVGIGTTTPTSKLTVIGDVLVSGILTASRIISSTYGEFVGGSISGSDIVGTSLSISGISTLGITSTTNLTTQQFNVSGLSTFAGIATHTASLFGTQASFTGVVTASSFVGNGAGLTGLFGVGSGVTITANTTNQSQFLTYVTQTGNVAGLGVTTGGLVFNPSTTRLGIGTATPRANLDVTNSILISTGVAQTADFLLKSYTNNGGTLSFENADSSFPRFAIDKDTSYLFRINDSDFVTKLTVNNSGNLGIGTTTPTSKLWVGGDGYFTGVVTATNFVGNLTGTATTATTATNVIGGIASVTSLTVTGLSSTSGSTTFIDSILISPSVGSTSSFLLKSYTNNGGTLSFENADSSFPRFGIDKDSSYLFKINDNDFVTKLTVDNSGNLGIGSTTPTSKLTVVGDVLVSGVVTATSFVGNGSQLTQVSAFNVIGGIASVTALNVTGLSTFIDSILISPSAGSTSSFSLKSYTNNNGSLSFEKADGTDPRFAIDRDTSYLFKVNDNDFVTKLTVDNSGNLGIGTTNPTAKLHVIGDVRVSGASTFGGIVELDNGLRDFYNNVGVAGSVLISTGAGVSWSASTPSAAAVTISNDNVTDDIRYPMFENITSGTVETVNVASDKLQFNPSSGTLSATVFTSLSDRTQKEDIRPIENAIGIVNQLTGVRYNWKNSINQPSIGLIAQDVEEVIPEVVVEMADGLKSVSYGNIVAVLIEAIKEQQVRIEELEDRLNA